MLIRRRIWLYRLPGQVFAQQISFERPVTAATVRRVLQRTVGAPLELWGRGVADSVAGHG
ncbi:MAG: hypothetical protein KJ634_12680 [Gammaproteobacteria bacterium]|jgi:hypothetical protein|nr:hypothetical protein [Gammaproteobacteria bacterium]MBU1416470.1 hypothetical protein [Gammaproteobacteria bacterium]